MNEALRGDPPEVSVGLYCSKGRHRSVAAAMFLWHCLRQEGRAVKVEHLSCWDGTCRGRCQECEGMAENVALRDSAFENALRIWRATSTV